MSGEKSTLREHFKKADRLMLFVTYGLVVYSFLLANIYDSWGQALVIGLSTAVVMTALYKIAAGTQLVRSALASGFMVLTGLHINQGHGLIELHFGVFALLAMLLYYRDWVPVIVAALTIAVHHVSFYWMQTQGLGVWVLSGDYQGWSVVFLHAGYVVAESAVLVVMAINLQKEAVSSAELMDAVEYLTHDKNSIDLSYRHESGESQVVGAFNNLLDLLDNVISKASDAGRSISQNGYELDQATENLVSAAENQNTQTNGIVVTVSEMATAIEMVAQSAQSAVDIVRVANDSAGKGVAASRQISEDIQCLAEQIQRGTQTVEKLAESSANIGSVLDVIRGIAEQTNLLALNAAIEAARAGEQGRGFAVVADEVRNLASKTQQSTEEINSMIEALQQGSREAVEAMNASFQYVGGCVDNSQEAVEVLKVVGDSINKISEVNEMIATAMQEQSVSTQQISNNVNLVKDVSDKSLQDVKNTETSSREIIETINRLDEILVQFSVSGSEG